VYSLVHTGSAVFARDGPNCRCYRQTLRPSQTPKNSASGRLTAPNGVAAIERLRSG
jgi:hypothetical protein